MKKIIIACHPANTHVCIVEDGKLVEFWVERESTKGIVGNIYKGKVMNVLPGMESAFVNIGLEKNAFLYAGDMIDVDGETKGEVGKKLNVKIGDEVLVQVVKDQFGTKGARISMNISLPSRGLILMPQTDYVGVSRKLDDSDEVKALTEFVEKNRKKGHGYILRTQCLDCPKEELENEIKELEDKWEKIQDGFMHRSAPSLIHKDESLAIRAVRDMLRSDVDEIVVDNKVVYNELIEAFPHVYEDNSKLFKLYEHTESIMYAYNLSSQIDALLTKKVEMSNGAYLVIDRTEALTVVDVNTGKYVGQKQLSETIFETNKVAAKEIARQLRLRNIGGIIVVDFIDMDKQSQIDEVMAILKEELSKDRIKTTLIDITPLGLVEITRKKSSSMIGDVMLQPCPYCNGDGYVYSEEHVATKIKQSLYTLFKNPMNTTAIVEVSINVFNKIFAYKLLEKECETVWKDKRIYLVPSDALHVEKYSLKATNETIIDLPDTAKLLY